MNWEALLVIGSLALIFGVILLIPTLWLVRKKATRASPRVRAIDVVTTLIVGSVLLAMFAAHQFYPDHPVVWWLWRALWLVVFPLMLWQVYTSRRQR